jgi:hypothetical protein
VEGSHSFSLSAPPLPLNSDENGGLDEREDTADNARRRGERRQLAGEESGSRERELGRRRLHLRDWKGRGSDGIGEEAAFSLSSQPRATREAGPSGLYRTHG